mmetsp:Transcript_22190/g.30983  ORF Transcript_22190/g.30983 Transcript_22190/m.30983 type:complete len:227 (-) Transcript_22190:106-786(-)
MNRWFAKFCAIGFPAIAVTNIAEETADAWNAHSVRNEPIRRLPSGSLASTMATISGNMIEPVRAVTEGIMGARMISAPMKQYARASVLCSPASAARFMATREAKRDLIRARAMKNAITTSHKFLLPRSFSAVWMPRQRVLQAIDTAITQRGPKPKPLGCTTAPTIVATKIASRAQPSKGTVLGIGVASIAPPTPMTRSHGHPSLDLMKSSIFRTRVLSSRTRFLRG